MLDATNQELLTELTYASFGDFGYIQDLIGLENFTYIATFPGPVIVLKLWNYKFDLSRYQGVNRYDILDKDMNYIYSVYDAKDNFYGYNENDLYSLLVAGNGYYFHMMLYTPNGRRLILLWVCYELAYTPRMAFLNALKNTVQLQNNRKSFINIQINTSGFKQGQIKGYLLRGYYDQFITPQIIKTNRARLEKIIEEGETIYLTPDTSAWYYFEANGRALEFINLKGMGTNRIIQKGGMIFIEVTSRQHRSSEITSEESITYTNNLVIGSENPIIEVAVTGGIRFYSERSDKNYRVRPKKAKININYLDTSNPDSVQGLPRQERKAKKNNDIVSTPTDISITPSIRTITGEVLTSITAQPSNITNIVYTTINRTDLIINTVLTSTISTTDVNTIYTIVDTPNDPIVNTILTA